MKRALLFALAGLFALSMRVFVQAQALPHLRVLTYNIHHGEGLDGRFDYERLAKVIRDSNPDVVALQEVDRKTKRADGVDQPALLGKLTGMQWGFGNALYFSGGEYGEAVLSRFPIEDVKAHHLPFHPGQEPRTALEVRVKPDNGLPELILVGTHLCHQSNETRVEQTQELNRILPASGGPPIILAGDLNAQTGSDPMKELLTERWIDATAPRSRIDYVLVRPADPWRVVSVVIVDERVVSDHRPVLVVLGWAGSTAAADERTTEPGKLLLPKRVVVPRLRSSIAVDGDLNEPVWAQAALLTPFFPNDGAGREREKTAVRLWYDETALYLGWTCTDADIQATFTARDSRFWEEEVVECFVAPKELSRYFELQWNPLGGVFDAIIDNELDEHGVSKSFKGDWSFTAKGMTSAVQVMGTVADSCDTDQSWQVEVKLPFADLGQPPPKPKGVWRANFYRFNRGQGRAVELLSWSPTRFPGFHQPSRFGYLDFGE